MEKQRIWIGSVKMFSPGKASDNRRVVEFIGQELASRTDYFGDDTRGITETLYRTDAGRYVVYVDEWTKWQEETCYRSLCEAQEEDLQPGGRFELLGQKAGITRPLTLDEALAT